MSEGASLYLLLWLLYLSECFIWIRKQGVAFVSPWSTGWRADVGSSFLANSRGGALLLNPLFPSNRVLVCCLSPVSISPDGICAFNAQSFYGGVGSGQTTLYFAFDDIKTCSREDRRILVNNVIFVDCSDLTESQRLEKLINQALLAPATQRQHIVQQFIAQRFAKTAAFDILENVWNRLRSLEVLCVMFFLLLFMIAPVMALRFGVELVLIPMGILMLVFAVGIASLFYHQHKLICPWSSSDRLSATVKMILCPPAAIRAVGNLTANIVSSYDPIVIASLLSPLDLKRFISTYLRDLYYPLKDGLDGPAKDIVQWYRAEILKQVTDYLTKEKDLRPELILASPVLENDCHTYCPRCYNQFTRSEGECAECDGVRLVESSSEKVWESRSRNE